MRTKHTIKQHEWPATTASSLADHLGAEAHHTPDQINQPIHALIKARKALSDARLACLRAAQFYPTVPEVRDRLASIAAAIHQEHERFPLSIIGQPLARRTPLSWVKPVVAPEIMTTKARKRATKLERVLSKEETNRVLHRVVGDMLGKPA